VTHFEIRNTDYTTLDRRMTFRFDFVQLESGAWRVYIVRQPGYGTRSGSAMASHRLSDARGSYICWDATIPTLDAAKGVARAWADATQVYIETGRFPPPGPPRTVPDWSTSSDWPLATRAGLVPAPAASAVSTRPTPTRRPLTLPARQSTPPSPASQHTTAQPAPTLRERLLRTWRNL